MTIWIRHRLNPPTVNKIKQQSQERRIRARPHPKPAGPQSAAERREEPRRSSRGPLCPQGTGPRGRRGQRPRRRRANAPRASSTRSPAVDPDHEVCRDDGRARNGQPPAQAAPRRASGGAVAEAGAAIPRAKRGASITAQSAAPRKAVRRRRPQGGGKVCRAHGGKTRTGGRRRRHGGSAANGGKDYGLLLLQSLGILGVVVSSDSLRYPAPLFPWGEFRDGSPRFGEFHHDARHGFSKKPQRGHSRTDRRGLRGGRRGGTGKATGGRRETGGIRFAVDGHGLGGTAGNGGGGRIGPVGAWGEAAAPSTLPPLGRLCFRAVRTRAEDGLAQAVRPDLARNPRRRKRSTPALGVRSLHGARVGPLSAAPTPDPRA